MAQSHFLPTSFLVSSGTAVLLGLGRSAAAEEGWVLEPELVDNKRLLVTHIWMLREMQVVVPMTAQQMSGRAVVKRRRADSRKRLCSPKEKLAPRLPTMLRVK